MPPCATHFCVIDRRFAGIRRAARAQKHPLPPTVATSAVSFIIQERRARLRERRRTRRRTDGRWNIERRIREMEPMAFFAGSTSRTTEAASRLCCLPTRATRVSPSRRKKWLEYAHPARFSIPHPYRIRPRFAFARTQRRFGSDPLPAGHCRTRGGPFRKRPYHGLFSRLI